MKLEIKGETALYNRLKSLNDVMQRTFWIGVQEDFEKRLLDNIKPHSKTTLLEQSAYVDILPEGGVEGGVRNRSGMMVNWRGERVNYGIFVEYGTKPHTIRPKDKKALSFFIGNTRVATKEVKHPGYKGDPFLRNAARKTFVNLEKIFNQELKNKGVL